jgi:UDPglucose 6-dehydrogenase
MNIGVIGCGYVGLVSATGFAELGHNVVAAESDAARLKLLQKGRSPFHEPYLPELLRKHTGARLQFRQSIEETVQQAKVVFICVGTPSLQSGEADLSDVDAAVREISRCVRSRLLVVEKSTVPVRTCDAIRHMMILNGVSPDLFSVASNPEFLREGTAVHDFLHPYRIVIGVADERSRRLLNRVYRPLTSGDYYRRSDCVLRESKGCIPMIDTNPESAELIKHASNGFLAMKISFINAVATIAESVGADISDVRAGLGSDPRIGSAFLGAGIGFGGPCFPKDLHAFRALARGVGCRFDLLSEVIRINQGQRFRFLEKVRTALSPLSGKRIAVLGLSFKGGTDDIRQSPAVEVVRHLVHEGAKITAFDPAAMIRARKEFSEAAVSFAADCYAAMTDADAVLILTEWPEFAALDLKRVRNLLRTPIVLDGRNLYRPCQMKAVGLNYVSVGRPSALASSNAAGSLPLPSSTDNDLWTQDKGSSLGSATQRLVVPIG